MGNVHRWAKMLLAILAGNALYFFLMPYLPEALQHDRSSIDAGLLVDFVICVLVYQGVRRIPL